MKKISFIGAGNMAKAMLAGIIKSELVDPKNIMMNAVHYENLKKIQDEFGVEITLESKEAVKFADIVIIAVKPNIVPVVFDEIKNEISDDKLIISVAAGVSIEKLEDEVGRDKRIVRAMPNTPALVGEAMSGISKNSKVDEDDLKNVLAIFNSFGRVEVVDEKLINSVISVSGSSPAYVFMFIEAMADAAVLSGMKRDVAYEFAAQSVLGAAKMVLDTKKHPGELKDMVCSPGGTTIRAVEVLEENGMRNAVIKAQKACFDKAVDMESK